MGITGSSNGIVVYLYGPSEANVESTKVIQCHPSSGYVYGNIYMNSGTSFSMSRLCADTLWTGSTWGQVTYLIGQSSFQNQTDSSFIRCPPDGQGSYAVSEILDCQLSIFKGNNASFNALSDYAFIDFDSVTQSSVEFDTRASNRCKDIYLIWDSGTETIKKTNGVNNTYYSSDSRGFFYLSNGANIKVTEGIFISNKYANYKYGSGTLTLEKCISSKNEFTEKASFTSKESPFTHTLSERAGLQCNLNSSPFSERDIFELKKWWNPGLHMPLFICSD